MSQNHQRAASDPGIRRQGASAAATRVVRVYLEALQAGAPMDPLTRAETMKRLAKIDAELPCVSDPIERLRLGQKRLDLEIELADHNFAQLEANVITVLGGWASAKGFSYKTLKEAGIPAHVLKAAGLKKL